MPLIRCLTQSGIDEFRDYLLTSDGEPDVPVPTHLLDSPNHAARFNLADIEIEQREFQSRIEFARYLERQAGASGLEGALNEQGLWEWLTLFYFDQVCPARPDGSRDILRVERYIPDKSRGWHYRHLLKGPCDFRRDVGNDDACELALSGPVHNHGGAYEHLVSRPRLRSSPGVQLAARALYYDENGKKPKVGISSGVTKVQEFARLLRNMPVEFDLRTMATESVLALIPSPFLDRLEVDYGQEVREARALFRQPEDPTFLVNLSETAEVLTSLESRPLTTMQRRIRSDRFRTGVIGAYSSRCAVSGIGLVHRDINGQLQYEVEAAHIIPVAANGSDVIANGLALCRTLHWAFDRGMIWVDRELRVGLTPITCSDDRNEWLRQFAGVRLQVPRGANLMPSAEALRWHAEHVAGVELS